MNRYTILLALGAKWGNASNIACWKSSPGMAEGPFEIERVPKSVPVAMAPKPSAVLSKKLRRSHCLFKESNSGVWSRNGSWLWVDILLDHFTIEITKIGLTRFVRQRRIAAEPRNVIRYRA